MHRLILAPFFNELTEEEKIYWHFTQKNATAQVEKRS
jgi:hypothetical protein